MGTQALSKATERMPSAFDDFFKPWNEWFEDSLFGRRAIAPATNIVEEKDAYHVSLAAPGLKKDDFKIDMDGDMLTISSEKKEEREENTKKFTRKEFNYSSFTRSFTLPEEINREKIEATYEDGILKITLPRKAEAQKKQVKQIPVN